MKVQIKNPVKILSESGDTIVEVLIAIAIAAFAIGISYATAQRSLQQAIAAREHTEALNILESQLADLSFRFQRMSTADFSSNIAGKTNFCLSDSAKGPSDPGWVPDATHQNSSVSSNSAPALQPSGPYASGCQTQNGGATYFANIVPSVPSGVPAGAVNPTLYNMTVRWYRAGGGINQASLFYKLNNSSKATLGLATSVSPAPSSCSENGLSWNISEDDTASPPRKGLLNKNGYQEFYGDWSAPWPINSSCIYTLQISTNSSDSSQPNQQMFIQLCADTSPPTCGDPLYTSGSLTSDITSSSPGSYSGSFSLSSTPKYILFKHCSLWPVSVGTCKNAAYLNPISGYDITITPTSA